MAEGPRVDCIKVHKSGSKRFFELSDGKDTATFYDLTIASHPSFYANGNLVHNCVDTRLSSEYNESIYQHLKITNEQVLDYGDDILGLLDFPQTHTKYKTTWIGMDVGYMTDPSELLVFAEEEDKKLGSKLTLVSRITLDRIAHEHQVATILWLLNFYKPRAFAMDKTGLGLPLYQDIQHRAKEDSVLKHFLDTIKGYNFSEKILVDFDDSIQVDQFRGDRVSEAGIKRNVLEYSTDKLRDLVDSKRLVLPIADKELIAEFQGQTYVFDKSTMDMYGRRRIFSTGQFHALDAARMAVLGWAQHGIDQMVKKPEYVPTTMVTFQ